MTAKQIFEANQVLTLAIAKTLIGKKIAITSPEYYMNQPMVRTFTLTDIASEFDLAAREKCEGYANRQEYWIAKLQDRIPEFKRTLKLVGEGDMPYASYDPVDRYFPEPTFSGSDADRAIYYLIVE